MPRRRITPNPERVRATRKAARRQGANMPFQGGIGQKAAQQCPAGQQPKMVNGKMTCVPATENAPVVPKPKSGNRGY